MAHVAVVDASGIAGRAVAADISASGTAIAARDKTMKRSSLMNKG
jgi:hypothetical protein